MLSKKPGIEQGTPQEGILITLIIVIIIKALN